MSTYNNQTGKLSPQSLLQQRYIIVGQAGRGGMGAVYQATDTRLAHRRVAIKEMSQGHLNDEEVRAANARFEQEAGMLGALSHPNLPRIYDAFSENGRSYLVMDFIEGKTLHQLLREMHGQPLPIAQILIYARQLCDVLFYLHQNNPPIIFRDVKPTNIMVTENGQIFLIDFGIARFFKEGQEQDTMLLGSPGYAPPEQHGIAQTNPRSDIYGLGATLHYCLTGRDPYHATPLFSFPPVRQINPLVPIELDQLIQRMLAHDERARPASALEVQQSLMAISQKAAENTSALAPASAPTNYISHTPQPNPASPRGTAPSGYTGTSVPLGQRPTVAVSPVNNITIPRLQMNPPQAPFWNSSFLRLFIAILLVTIAGGIFAVSTFFITDGANQIEYGWALIIEASLALLLFLIALIANLFVKGMLPRVILAITALTTLISGLTFISLGSIDILQALGVITTSLTGNTTIITGTNQASFTALYQVITSTLAVTTLASFSWFSRPALREHPRIPLILLVGAALCVSAQLFYLETSITRHALLLIALIALTLGALMIARAEQLASQAGKLAAQHL